MNLKQVHFDLEKDGFCFLPRVFSDQETQNSLEELWRIINKEYRTGCEQKVGFGILGMTLTQLLKSTNHIFQITLFGI